MKEKDWSDPQPDSAIQPKAQGLLHMEREYFAHLLALLKYPFYPLFILDNGMNSISKSLTVLTPA